MLPWFGFGEGDGEGGEEGDEDAGEVSWGWWARSQRREKMTRAAEAEQMNHPIQSRRGIVLDVGRSMFDVRCSDCITECSMPKGEPT